MKLYISADSQRCWLGQHELARKAIEYKLHELQMWEMRDVCTKLKVVLEEGGVDLMEKERWMSDIDLVIKGAPTEAIPVSIGVIGRTGVGKSELVNALLGYRVLEAEGMGVAVTNVPTVVKFTADLYGYDVNNIDDADLRNHISVMKREYMETGEISFQSADAIKFRLFLPGQDYKKLGEWSADRLVQEARTTWPGLGSTDSYTFSSYDELGRALKDFNVKWNSDELFRHRCKDMTVNLPCELLKEIGSIVDFVGTHRYYDEVGSSNRNIKTDGQVILLEKLHTLGPLLQNALDYSSALKARFGAGTVICGVTKFDGVLNSSHQIKPERQRFIDIIQQKWKSKILPESASSISKIQWEIQDDNGTASAYLRPPPFTTVVLSSTRSENLRTNDPDWKEYVFKTQMDTGLPEMQAELLIMASTIRQRQFRAVYGSFHMLLNSMGKFLSSSILRVLVTHDEGQRMLERSVPLMVTFEETMSAKVDQVSLEMNDVFGKILEDHLNMKIQFVSSSWESYLHRKYSEEFLKNTTLRFRACFRRGGEELMNSYGETLNFRDDMIKILDVEINEIMVDLIDENIVRATEQIVASFLISLQSYGQHRNQLAELCCGSLAGELSDMSAEIPSLIQQIRPRVEKIFGNVTRIIESQLESTRVSTGEFIHNALQRSLKDVPRGSDRDCSERDLKMLEICKDIFRTDAPTLLSRNFEDLVDSLNDPRNALAKDLNCLSARLLKKLPSTSKKEMAQIWIESEIEKLQSRCAMKFGCLYRSFERGDPPQWAQLKLIEIIKTVNAGGIIPAVEQIMARTRTGDVFPSSPDPLFCAERIAQVLREERAILDRSILNNNALRGSVGKGKGKLWSDLLKPKNGLDDGPLDKRVGNWAAGRTVVHAKSVSTNKISEDIHNGKGLVNNKVQNRTVVLAKSTHLDNRAVVQIQSVPIHKISEEIHNGKGFIKNKAQNGTAVLAKSTYLGLKMHKTNKVRWDPQMQKIYLINRGCDGVWAEAHKSDQALDPKILHSHLDEMRKKKLIREGCSTEWAEAHKLPGEATKADKEKHINDQFAKYLLSTTPVNNSESLPGLPEAATEPPAIGNFNSQTIPSTSEPSISGSIGLHSTPDLIPTPVSEAAASGAGFTGMECASMIEICESHRLFMKGWELFAQGVIGKDRSSAYRLYSGIFHAVVSGMPREEDNFDGEPMRAMLRALQE